jgi:hypothetical protein
MEYKEENLYPSLNEVYNPEWMFLNIDDSVPTYLKKEFKKMVRLIMTELSEDGFTESEVEDYLKQLVERALV